MNIAKIAETLWQEKERKNFETSGVDLEKYKNAKNELFEAENNLKKAKKKMYEISRMIMQHSGVSRELREEANKYFKDLHAEDIRSRLFFPNIR